MKNSKYIIGTFFLITSFSFTMASCSKGSNSDIKIHNGNSESSDNPTVSEIKVTIGPTVFTATLHNNPTAAAFREMLPLTINMVELNGNEKYFDMENELPNNTSNPGTIQSGDIMLYGSKTLVLFYKSFSTSYRYTKIGRIADPSGLATALGSKDVTVTFSE